MFNISITFGVKNTDIQLPLVRLNIWQNIPTTNPITQKSYHGKPDTLC